MNFVDATEKNSTVLYKHYYKKIKYNEHDHLIKNISLDLTTSVV
jgi:hypothetical protein